MRPFSARMRRIERTAEYVGGSGRSPITSATVAWPRRNRMFITCRSRRVNPSLSFSFAIVMLIFQHQAPDVKPPFAGATEKSPGGAGLSLLWVRPDVAGGDRPGEAAGASGVAAFPAAPAPPEAAHRPRTRSRRSEARPFACAVRRS